MKYRYRRPEIFIREEAHFKTVKGKNDWHRNAAEQKRRAAGKPINPSSAPTLPISDHWNRRSLSQATKNDTLIGINPLPTSSGTRHEVHVSPMPEFDPADLMASFAPPPPPPSLSPASPTTTTTITPGEVLPDGATLASFPMLTEKERDDHFKESRARSQAYLPSETPHKPIKLSEADLEALAAVAAQARPVTGADYLAQEKGTSTKITDPEAELALFISIARDPGSATWMAGSEPLHHRYDAWRAGPDAEAQINPPPKQRRKGAEASAEAASAEAT